MFWKILYTILILIICGIVYTKIKDNEHSLFFVIITGLITTIVGNLIIPSNISIFDVFNSAKKSVNIEETTEETTTKESSNNLPTKKIVNNTSTKEITSIKQSTIQEEPVDGQLIVLPINLTTKKVDDIKDNLLIIEPIKLNYYKGTINKKDQIDTYQFTPKLNGRYRFQITEMLSGVTVNMIILNQANKEVESTSFGIENNTGLTVNNMIANETYTIQIKQYSGYSSYKILLGCQKEIINIDNNITQITDSIQYTDQKNIYRFTPPLNGRYRFEFAEIISGAKVNICIYNPGKKVVDSTSSGIANGGGLTINNMKAGETYEIVITQYSNNTNYKLLIGYQKETIKINKETEILDCIQYTGQTNQYQFIPPINGRYRFEISNLTSGVKVNMVILNQSGGNVKGTTYGLINNYGMTIDNMVAGETYTIQIIQYNSYSSYKLKIGYQKETVKFNTKSISDEIQYTDQKNIYKFTPKSTGNYSFIINKMVSGMKINISIYNEGGERIGNTLYGIKNNEGLAIKNMIQGETYTIYVTQYESKGSYLLTVN